MPRGAMRSFQDLAVHADCNHRRSCIASEDSFHLVGSLDCSLQVTYVTVQVLKHSKPRIDQGQGLVDRKTPLLVEILYFPRFLTSPVSIFQSSNSTTTTWLIGDACYVPEPLLQ